MNCSIGWEAIAGISSAVIALCALGLTIWQFKVQRTYNKLSVKPYLTTWTTTSPDGYIIVKIINNGVGPARINSFSIYVDGVKMVGEGLERHKKCLDIIFSDFLFDWYGSYFGVGYMMRSHEDRDLIAVRFVGQRTPNRTEVDHRAKRVRILIKYESIYGDQDTYDSQDEINKQEH